MSPYIPPTPIKVVDICPNQELDQLYKNWGNGGVDDSYRPPLERTPYASVRDPQTTLVDQSICSDFAKQTCLDVRGDDRFASCQEGQYQSCMNGRKRLIWGVDGGDT